MDLKLINDLNESRQYRSKSAFRHANARTVADHTFMDMIAVWILYNEFEFAPESLNYASKTVAYNRFNTYRQSGTDLYLNLHVITEKRNDLLGNDDADVTLLDRIQLDVGNIVRYLRQIGQNSMTPSKARQTLQRLEQALYIDNSNYRSVRRLAQGWPTLSTNQKRLVITRMLMFYKMNARKSEMYPLLAQLGKSKNLVDKDAKNPEKLSPWQKAAVVGAAGAGGYAAGYKLGKSLT